MEILDIKYKDVTIEIHGDYSPEEAEVRYYSDGSGHPGCSAEFDICHIFCGSTDIFIYQIGIAWGMGGYDYSFCEKCLKDITAKEFWKRMFKEEGNTWPPKLKGE